MAGVFFPGDGVGEEGSSELPDPAPCISAGKACPPTGARRIACEQCHKAKEKCEFFSNQKSCFRCLRLQKTCRSRLKARMGRRPVAPAFPYGAHAIINLAPRARRHKSQDQSSNFVELELSDTYSASSYTVAGECVPKPRIFGPSWMEELHDTDIFAQLLVGNKTVRTIFANEEGFFNAHRRFMLGKSFTADFYSAALLVFRHSPYILTDGYCALVGSLATACQNRETEELYHLGLVSGARCLRYLTTITPSVAKLGHAAVVITLGQILLAYNALLPRGFSTRTITRGTLSSIRGWYPLLHQRQELDAITIAPVLVDTVDCLIRRDMPVLRFPSTGRCIVDRFAGIASSLLPLLYDLCECSYQMKHMNPTIQSISSDHNGAIWDRYSEIEQKIAAWKPTIPPDFFAKYTASEVAIMLANATSYRLASLLIIHRLRFPLGYGDDTASRYAEAILEELSPTKVWPCNGATGLGFDFPLMVAMIEVPSAGKETFIAFNAIRLMERQSKDILKLVERISKARESGYSGLWFDFVDEWFSGDILP
ncbi:hypothetical protein QQS21_009688 [Conoideocrella luteorostrata]|uniref:Zn(2)-C6 fungal-type domain-containing protein n=1 Tax=Conoideocrella luteorostrata TaxID=1105319 RepID=A0AAJ0CIT3_9HYPO|nr:hypothetical protein QQS21_009688 [Conoideocrella luteorostrata]